MKPEVIAHRGSSHDHRGNTWPAFLAAQRDGADAIECDVQLSADGHLIVRHDLYLNGRRIVEMMEHAIRRADPDVVALQELLDWARREGIGLLVEIKDIRCVERLMQDIKQSTPWPQLTVGSFHGPALLAVKERNGVIGTSFMIGSVMGTDEMAFLAARYRCDGVHPCWELRDPYPRSLMVNDKVTALRKKGLKLTLWHEERVEELDHMIELGADAICTDTPAVLRRLVDRKAVATA